MTFGAARFQQPDQWRCFHCRFSMVLHHLSTNSGALFKHLGRSFHHQQSVNGPAKVGTKSLSKRCLHEMLDRIIQPLPQSLLTKGKYTWLGPTSSISVRSCSIAFNCIFVLWFTTCYLTSHLVVQWFNIHSYWIKHQPENNSQTFYSQIFNHPFY